MNPGFASSIFNLMHVYGYSSSIQSLLIIITIIIITIFLHGTVSLIKITKELESDFPTGRA